MNRTSLHRRDATYPEARTSGKVFAAIAATFVSLTLIGGVLGLFELQAERTAVATVGPAHDVLIA